MTREVILNLIFTFICKDGIARTAVAAKVTDTGVLFAMKEITDERPMYRRFPGKLLSWAESDERQVMNTKDLTMLPDDLVAEIAPRRIVQLIGGEEVVTEDKLWAFSATELFGRGGRHTESDGSDDDINPHVGLNGLCHQIKTNHTEHHTAGKTQQQTDCPL